MAERGFEGTFEFEAFVLGTDWENVHTRFSSNSKSSDSDSPEECGSSNSNSTECRASTNGRAHFTGKEMTERVARGELAQDWSSFARTPGVERKPRRRNAYLREERILAATLAMFDVPLRQVRLGFAALCAGEREIGAGAAGTRRRHSNACNGEVGIAGMLENPNGALWGFWFWGPSGKSLDGA